MATIIQNNIIQQQIAQGANIDQTQVAANVTDVGGPAYDGCHGGGHGHHYSAKGMQDDGGVSVTQGQSQAQFQFADVQGGSASVDQFQSQSQFQFADVRAGGGDVSVDQFQSQFQDQGVFAGHRGMVDGHEHAWGDAAAHLDPAGGAEWWHAGHEEAADAIMSVTAL